MREILEAGLPALGIDVSCISNLEKFSAMLLEKNQVMNLTAITEPAQVATLHLLDSLGKRVKFLEEVREALDLQNVACVHGRAEEFAGACREGFDIAVSRAVASLATLCELCLPLVKVGGVFLAMKSTGCEAEVEAAGRAIRLLGGELRESVDYTIPSTDVTHRLVVVAKTAPTPKKYPRAFAQIKKQPL